ncbi:MAG: efflux RND transporter periplasmic adaptor subunit, partial [Gemmatimonadales bacterium]
ASDGQRVEIRSGVAAGELVVIAGQLNLREGAAVTVRGAGSDGAPPGLPPRPRPGGGSPAVTPTPRGANP